MLWPFPDDDTVEVVTQHPLVCIDVFTTMLTLSLVVGFDGICVMLEMLWLCPN